MLLPRIFGACVSPVLTASVNAPHGAQWPSPVWAIAMSRIDPGTLERRVSPIGVSENRSSS